MGYLIFQVLGRFGCVLQTYKLSTKFYNGAYRAILTHIIDTRLNYAIKWRGTTYYIQLPIIEYHSPELSYITNVGGVDILFNIMFNIETSHYQIYAIDIFEKKQIDINPVVLAAFRSTV